MTPCNEITTEAQRIKSLFDKCYNLKSKDLKDIVELIESVNLCSNGSFSLKTINGESLFGVGDIIINDGSGQYPTSIVNGNGINISGTGEPSDPYIISSTSQDVDGSETVILQGSNVIISGTGTQANPYVINVSFPPQATQVNSDWSATSGPSQILNKPTIPAAQVKADWNAMSGPAEILNKPATLGTNISFTPTEFGGTIGSSNGTGADIPLVSDAFPGLISKEQIDDISLNTDNINTEIAIPVPVNKTNAAFAEIINNLPNFDINKNQIVAFKAIDSSVEDPRTYYAEILGRNSGNYGTGGYQLNDSEVRVTSFALSSSVIESEQNTQIIDLGTTASTVVQAINGQAPSLSIQSQSSGYSLIRGTFAGFYEEYLWVGNGGLYGLLDLQATYDDLRKLGFEGVQQATAVVSGTVKTDVSIANPVVYTTETVDSLLFDKAERLHASEHEAGGSDEIQGENLSVNILPPTANYVPVTPTLKGHLQGVDIALGNVTQTTAGITNRVFFTGETITLPGGTFYKSNPFGKGTVGSASPTPLSNDDNQKSYFAQDIISSAFTEVTIAPAGVYSGNLSVRISADNAQQRYSIEVYRTDINGNAIASGVTGAPVGSLGVTVVSIIDSGLVNLVAGDSTSVNLSGVLSEKVTFNVNERLRYRVSAEKVGTTAGAITMEVFYGSNHNSYYDVPVISDTNSVLNRSSVPGTTTSNALDSLNSSKAPIASVHNPVTIGTANGLSLSTQVLSLGLASSGVNGALSGTDWNTFNNKQNALTNPVTGTGATGQVSFWNSTGTQLGDNALFWDNTNKRLGVGTSTPTTELELIGLSKTLNTQGNLSVKSSNSHAADLGGVITMGGSYNGALLTNFAAISGRKTNNTANDISGYMQFATNKIGIGVREVARLNHEGRFLLGQTTDNLTDIAQFNGSAIATAWKVTGGLVTQYQTGTGTVVDFGTSVRGTVLTGFTSGAGSVTPADNILEAIQKLDGNITSVADSQIEIGANTNVLNTWNGKTILFTANCTVTVPSSLINQLSFVFRTLAGVTVTWSITAPFTWETTPTTTPEKTTGNFMRRGSTNTILLDF